MSWHPKLTVRFGRGGGISSPTTSSGYAFTACIALVFVGAILAAALTRKPLFLLALIVPGIFLRDAWAWFAASSEERRAFLSEIDAHVARGARPPGDQVRLADGRDKTTVAFVVVWLALSIAGLAVLHKVVFLLSLMWALSVFCALMIDVFRAWRYRRASDRDNV